MGGGKQRKGRGKQRKIRWIVIFHHEDKPGEFKYYKTMRDITDDLGISRDRIFYLHCKHKRHTQFKCKSTKEFFNKMNIIKITDENKMDKIIASLYPKN